MDLPLQVDPAIEGFFSSIAGVALTLLVFGILLVLLYEYEALKRGRGK
jgi:hypothetical protein